MDSEALAGASTNPLATHPGGGGGGMGGSQRCEVEQSDAGCGRSRVGRREWREWRVRSTGRDRVSERN